MRCYMQVARWHGGIQVCIIHSFFSLLFFSAEEEEMDGVIALRKSRKQHIHGLLH